MEGVTGVTDLLNADVKLSKLTLKCTYKRQGMGKKIQSGGYSSTVTRMAASSSTRDPQLRKDLVNNKWVIISPARSKRPSDLKSKSPATNHQIHECPFCVGHEHECAPEIFRFPPQSKSDWKIRVIQNLYPALSREIEYDPGVGDTNVRVLKGAGFGFHDVVIESPTHPVHLSDLLAKEVGDVILAYKQRVMQVASVEGIKYIQIFKNHGASAGASMSHSHSQMIALPVIPPMLTTRLESMKNNFDQTGKCVLCEAPPKELLIAESKHFIAMVPFAASYSFEIWIFPRTHSSHFHHIDDEKAADLGGLLKLMLRKISVQLNDPPFNYMIHTSPLEIDDSYLPSTHWFLQIIPQLSVLAGFEVGTGCHINSVFPEDAAKVLREAKVE